MAKFGVKTVPFEADPHEKSKFISSVHLITYHGKLHPILIKIPLRGFPKAFGMEGEV